MKVLGNRLLIEQTMIRKTALLVTSKDQAALDNFDVTRRIIEISTTAEPTELKVGDNPIFGKFSEPSALSITEKSHEKIVSLMIYNLDDIVGIDDEQSL